MRPDLGSRKSTHHPSPTLPEKSTKAHLPTENWSSTKVLAIPMFWLERFCPRRDRATSAECSPEIIFQAHRRACEGWYVPCSIEEVQSHLKLKGQPLCCFILVIEINDRASPSVFPDFREDSRLFRIERRVADRSFGLKSSSRMEKEGLGTMEALRPHLL